MVGYFDVKNFFNGLLDNLDPGIAEFHNLPGIGKDHMIMLPVEIRFLVLCLVLAKLMPPHQLAIQ
jgi:hypothetical protein